MPRRNDFDSNRPAWDTALYRRQQQLAQQRNRPAVWNGGGERNSPQMQAHREHIASADARMQAKRDEFNRAHFGTEPPARPTTPPAPKAPTPGDLVYHGAGFTIRAT
jgi:hypothetical protein